MVFIRPFLSSLGPLFESESKCETVPMKKTFIDLHETETTCRTHFLMNGFALRLVLKQAQENSEMAYRDHSSQSQGTQTIQ